MKHKVVINVVKEDGEKLNALKGATMKLPSRLIKFLLGDFRQVYVLSPGQTVESVDIKEIRGGN